MKLSPNLWILRLTVPAAYADFFSDALENGSLAISSYAPPRQNDAVIEVIYGHDPDQTELAAKLAILSEVIGEKPPVFTVKPAPNLDWLKKVAEDFPPLKIARWTVHGAMHRNKLPNHLFGLQIDATNAFGTGEHPTTRGCLIMLDKLLKRGFHPRSMADIGCGSGILAMGCVQAARGKGMKRAVAVDLDPDSVQIARNNVRSNGLGGAIRVGLSHGYAASMVKAAAPYDLIMSNIFARPLAQIAKDLRKHLRPGGYVILAGLLTIQAKMVIAAHRMQGLALVEHMRIGEWSVLALNRPDRA